MSDLVVIVGPKAISGRGAVDPELATTALESIDDDLALVDGVVVSVEDLWSDVLGSAVGGRCTGLLVVCPSWWATLRIARVAAAARRWSDDVEVRRRVDVRSAAATVVELGPELVVVHRDGRWRVIARGAHGVVDAVVASVDGLTPVTVDVPAGLELLGTNLVRALRLRDVDVTLVDDRALVDAVGGHEVPAVRWRPTPRAAGMAAAVLVVGGLTLTAASLDARTAEPADATWLVEGRVAVEVPARWIVERITSGPGSARVQVMSPNGGSEAVHLTQSRVPQTQTLDDAATALRSALAEEPDGVFVDFVVGRTAITYREVRAERHVDWTVSLDGGVRIAIGCQGGAERRGPRPWCDAAVDSAHAVDRK